MGVAVRISWVMLLLIAAAVYWFYWRKRSNSAS